MEGLNSEPLDTNVRVSVVFPGAIATNIAVNSGVAMTQEERAALPKEITEMKMTPSRVAAEKIVRGIEKKSYHVFIGSDAIMMDELSRLMPMRAAKIVYSHMCGLLPLSNAIDNPGNKRTNRSTAVAAHIGSRLGADLGADRIFRSVLARVPFDLDHP